MVSRGGQTGPPLPGSHDKSWPSCGGLLCPPRLIDLPRRAPKEARHGKSFEKNKKEEEKPTRAWIWAALDLDLAVDVDPPPSPGSAAAPARSRHRQIRRRRLRPDRPRLDPPDVEEEGGARGRSGLPGHATAGSAVGASTGAAPAWICPPAPGSARWRRGRRSLQRIRPPWLRHRWIYRRDLRHGHRRLDLPGGEGEGGTHGRSGLPGRATIGTAAVHA